MTDDRVKVCMIVTSELDRDPRVQKEADLAHNAGYDVSVVCRSYTGPEKAYEILPLNVNRRSTRIGKYLERLWANVKLVNIMLKCRPHIIHANDMDTLPSGFIASRLAGSKLLYDAHELWASAGRDVGALGSKLLLVLEKLLSRKANAVVAVSSYRAHRMMDILSIPLPTVVMNTPNYIPASSLSPDDWINQFEGKRVVLHQGRYVPGRGIPEAVLAAKHLPDDIVLVFRGYGPIEEDLRALVKEHHLSSQVFLIPPVPMNQLVECAVGADIGLTLYTPINENNLYAAPNKMFEYMMAGVPGVGSDIPYVRDILLGLGVGEVFEPGNPEALAEATLRILNDSSRLSQMKERCLECARQFCWENEGARIIREYKRLVSENR